jgi:hypothetical protein
LIQLANIAELDHKLANLIYAEVFNQLEAEGQTLRNFLANL